MTQTSQEMHTLYILGNAYVVPAGLTIMTSMEYAGFYMTRGCGCRGAVCGACAVLYRVKNTAPWSVGLACQTLTKDHMTCMFLPYAQGHASIYNASTNDCTLEMLLATYPQLKQCIRCNTCTLSCPMHIKVLDFVNALRKGDFTSARDLSMECILCGMCAVRCPRELSPFAMALMARRLHAIAHLEHTQSFHVGLQKAQDMAWHEEIQRYACMSKEELEAMYKVFQAEKGLSGVN